MKKIAIGGAVALGLVLLAKRLTRQDLRGKVAVVCGASRGLGRAIALELARRGANVAICARSDRELWRTKRDLERYGVRVFAEPCDLRRDADTRAFLGGVVENLGNIDILITNAATITVAPIDTLSARDFEESMKSVFTTALHPSLAVLPSMKERGTGTIAFVTSIGGKIGVPHLSAYSAAKFAAVGYANTLRAEVAQDGVHVMTVVPGLMRTGSHLRAQFRGDPEKEVAWFEASAMTPIMSISASRAARRIVDGLESKANEVVFTLPARIAARTHDLFPGLWAALTAFAARMLPAVPAQVEDAEGQDVIPFTRELRNRSNVVARKNAEIN